MALCSHTSQRRSHHAGFGIRRNKPPTDVPSSCQRPCKLAPTTHAVHMHDHVIPGEFSTSPLPSKRVKDHAGRRAKGWGLLRISRLTPTALLEHSRTCNAYIQAAWPTTFYASPKPARTTDRRFHANICTPDGLRTRNVGTTDRSPEATRRTGVGVCPGLARCGPAALPAPLHGHLAVFRLGLRLAPAAAPPLTPTLAPARTEFASATAVFHRTPKGP